MRSPSALVALVGLAGAALADPTWPSVTDELEEIMYQLTSFGARKFADTVSPCTNEASGPGRQNAAEWLRTAFHDMSTANMYFGAGGLDGSLQYELANGENTGPGHETTLKFMGDYLTPRSSLADLIALGVYTSVRSCGGPAVPIRGGRKDASAKGATGVPLPQNSAVMFQQQFERMGFTKQEMIQLTACGHTLGGVHSTDFPELTPPGAKNSEAPSDSTVAVFDNRVVTEYLDGKTENPLVVGPSAGLNKNSDFKVFNSDGNKTLEELRDPDTFRAVCKKVLQKMIDVVPPGVALSDPIAPYNVKPVGLQLTLERGGNALALKGYIRVRTTGLTKDGIKHVAVTYKDSQGSAACGASSCTLTSTVQGVGQGFDETFAFFPLDGTIPASSGISSFTVTVHHCDGTSKLYDNNSHGYPMQDAVVFQGAAELRARVDGRPDRRGGGAQQRGLQGRQGHRLVPRAAGQERHGRPGQGRVRRQVHALLGRLHHRGRARVPVARRRDGRRPDRRLQERQRYRRHLRQVRRPRAVRRWVAGAEQYGPGPPAADADAAAHPGRGRVHDVVLVRGRQRARSTASCLPTTP